MTESFPPNPYAVPTEVSGPPEADHAHSESPADLRWLRFWGSMIDGLVIIAVVFLVMVAAALLGIADWFADEQPLTVVQDLVVTLIGFGMLVLAHGYPLITRGQSIGKMLLKLQIVDNQDESLLSPFRVLGLRYLWLLPLSVLSVLVPGFGIETLIQLLGVVDALFIFRSDGRCLHDLIAGSKVVRYVPGRLGKF